MTTILAVKKDDQVAIAGDGQVTLGEKVIMKHSAKKVRTLYHGKVVTGFAGSVSDAITLFEKFENHLESSRGNLTKAAVEMAKEWRSDKVLKNLEAMLIVANKEDLLVLSGNGEVITPDFDDSRYRLRWFLCLCSFISPDAEYHSQRRGNCP